ncbi:DUF488 family protein [Acaryochloris sp. CCMEE 5410]|uniref:DUF488 family protein, N3 subclade n=1 Tax=Acaryochloris sp. CCMEE 5410 TaxID=310037 RepID=UPI0002484711|nr:DUF488 family protein [Acaryochloris sp. CCMEE 5410]KAI9129387.1 DUF488 family protein [Acaryochloris sp. CCMEE 5410]
MAIYSASYFEPQNHHGSLISISRSHPRSFKVDAWLSFLAPSQRLLDDWKHNQLNEEEYTDRYRQELQQSWPQVNSWLTSLTAERDCTLLCWEKAGEFCHRNLAMKAIRKHRPDCYGGCDITADPGLRCPSCQSLVIPGVDQCYCPRCGEWIPTPI